MARGTFGRCRLVAALLGALLLACWTGGCGSSGRHSTTTARGQVRVRIHWPAGSARLIPSTSQSLTVELQRDGRVLPGQAVVISRPQATATFSEVPAGYLVMRATAFPEADGSGVAQATGQTGFAVVASQATDVALALGSTVDGFTIAPDPTLCTVGRTAALVATARDSAGRVVLVPAQASTTWSVASGGACLSLPSTRAVSDYTATVTGLASGTATVQAALVEAPGATPRTATATVTVSLASGGMDWTVLACNASAILDRPDDVATDAAGNLYVADTDNHRIQRRDSGGNWTQWGCSGSAVGQFSSPGRVAVDPAGNVYVADTGNDRIQRRDSSGHWTVVGSADAGLGALREPGGVVADGTGSLYISDSGHNRIEQRDAGGTWTVLGGPGPGLGQFNGPRGLAVDTAGSLYVADFGNDRIQKRDAAGQWTAIGGSGHGAGAFWGPEDVDVDRLGNVYVADSWNQRIQRRDPRGAWTVFGSSGQAAGQFEYPSGVAVAPSGEIWVADWGNDRVQTMGANGEWLVWGGGSAAEDRFTAPTCLALDPSGHVLVGAGNGWIYQQGPTGWLPLAVLGGARCLAGGAAGPCRGGDDVMITQWVNGEWVVRYDFGRSVIITGMAEDADGTLYATDQLWNVLWRIGPSGDADVLTSVSTGTHLDMPQGVACDTSGGVYVTDTNNQRVLKRDRSGAWTVLGGPGSGLGQFQVPLGVAVDTHGNLYVSDTGRIQRRDAAGAWTAWSSPGDGRPFAATDLAVDTAGRLYVCEPTHQRLLIGTPVATGRALRVGARGATH